QIVEFSATGTLREDALSGLPGVRGVQRREETYALTVSDIGAALHALLTELEWQRATLITLTTHQATLEDVFVHLTGRMLRDV
ncbi:MAG TPA: DUF4162 domain-containing protein, partial [Pyrinomonadaceae bacterium]